MNYIKAIIFWILSVQEKVLTKKLERNLKNVYKNSTTKRSYSKDYSLLLNSTTERNKSRLEFEVKNIVKQSKNNPDLLLEFIEKRGTKVYKFPKANLILGLILEEEGLICPKKGLAALYLSFVTSILNKEGLKLKLKTDEMFILRDLPIDAYYMLHQFHKWYALKLNLPGFNSEAQENFRKIFCNKNEEQIKSLHIEEILDLKEAIARDVDAINFVVDLAKSSDGCRQALVKVTSGEGANI